MQGEALSLWLCVSMWRSFFWKTLDASPHPLFIPSDSSSSFESPELGAGGTSFSLFLIFRPYLLSRCMYALLLFALSLQRRRPGSGQAWAHALVRVTRRLHVLGSTLAVALEPQPPAGFIRHRADVFVFIRLSPVYLVSLSWFHNQEKDKYIDPHSTVMLD